MSANPWQPAVIDPAQPGGWALAHCRQRFVANADGVLFPREWLKAQLSAVLAEHGIGRFRGQPVFVLELQDDGAELPRGCFWKGLRQFMLEGDPTTFRMLGYAAQIATWARQHRFCGSCGAPLQAVPGERAMACPSCALQQYPRLSPSIIVLISRGDELLLARSPRFVTGVYSTLAGFVEPGESIEACVHREVREEVAVAVDNLRYIASQSWPFPHSLMLGFHADYAGGEIVPQPEEIEDARWFHVDELPPLPAHGSIARYLIELYLARRSGGAEPVLPG
jgi:NAD+ diphosphatase